MKVCPVCGNEVIGRADKKYCSDKCGNVARCKKHVEKHQGSPEWKASQKKRNAKFRRKPYGKYSDHKHRAKQSGIEFKLTFEEWWSLWQPFYYLNDGIKYCMCRYNDTGAYELGNVRIASAYSNNLEKRLNETSNN